MFSKKFAQKWQFAIVLQNRTINLMKSLRKTEVRRAKSGEGKEKERKLTEAKLNFK
jgi:hypothetical protein